MSSLVYEAITTCFLYARAGARTQIFAPAISEPFFRTGYVREAGSSPLGGASWAAGAEVRCLVAADGPLPPWIKCRRELDKRSCRRPDTRPLGGPS